MHGDKTRGDDNAILILEFDGGVTGDRRGELDQARAAWTTAPRSTAREGVAYADLLHGNAIETYSARGYDYAVEKAGSTQGLDFTIYEEAWNYGFPQEMAHFVDCVQNDKQPLVTGEDGKAVLEDHLRRVRVRGHGAQGAAAVARSRQSAVRAVEREVIKLIHCAGYEPMSKAAAECITDVLAHKRDAVLCAAAGNSPTGLYRELARAGQKNPDLFAAVRIVKLDDWLGVPPDHPASCEHYLRITVVEPLRISSDRYLGFRPDAADPPAGMHARASGAGPTRSRRLILGLGANGHIGLNEPASSLEVGCHVALLTAESRRHALLADVDPKPTHGVTLGVGDILRARKIVLLITGRGKERAISELLAGKLTTALPASLLALHDDVDAFIDDSSVTSGT